MNLRVLSLLLVFISARTFAGDSVLLHLDLDNLPSGGLSLHSGWKYQSGDNPEWASVGFNDAGWRSVDLDDFAGYFPARQNQLRGWFRKRVVVDSSMAAHPTAISLWQLGASEMFLDGKPFLHLGFLYSDGRFTSDNPHYKPFLVQLTPGDSLTIAIRFVSHLPSPVSLFTRTRALPLSIRIEGWNQALDRYESALLEQRLPVGSSFLSAGFGIVFFLLYSFFRDRKVYLLFAAFCFLLSTMAGLQHQLAEGNLTVRGYSMVFFLDRLADKTSEVLLLCIVALSQFNRISGYQWSVIFYFLALTSLLEYFLAPSRASDLPAALGRALLGAELIRMAWYALRKRSFFLALISLAGGLLLLLYGIDFFSHTGLTALYDRISLILGFALVTVYLISTLRLPNASPA
jgi:hypothetical protein